MTIDKNQYTLSQFMSYGWDYRTNNEKDCGPRSVNGGTFGAILTTEILLGIITC
jgi:hypothetical protein